MLKLWKTATLCRGGIFSYLIHIYCTHAWLTKLIWFVQITIFKISSKNVLRPGTHGQTDGLVLIQRRWLLCLQFASGLWCHWCRESSYMAVLPDKAAPQRDVAPDIISVIKFSHTADCNIIRSKRWLLCTPRCLLCLLVLVCTIISKVQWNNFYLQHRR